MTAAYRVQAYNTAKESENKIHDDAVAARFGFTGGLVPGVDVYAYMTHLPVARWGRAWLERGTAECRFGKPVYDGEIAEVAATDTPDGMSIAVTSCGESCASGAAGLPAGQAPPNLADYPASAVPEFRPPANEASLAVGRWLSARPVHATPEFAAKYLLDVREAAPLYAAEGLVHPGLVLRLCNWALGHNVVLGPWIHVGSKVRNFAAARVGDALNVRARVSGNYMHKGHKFVELDALVVANGTTAVAHVTHTAIYLPRQVAAG